MTISEQPYVPRIVSSIDSVVDMISIAQIAKTKILVHKQRVAHAERRQLWNEAAKSVPDLDLPAIDEESIEDGELINTVHTAVQDKLDECIRKRWKYTRSNGQKVVLWDMLDKIMKWINRFKDVGDVAIQYDPGHAALPWAAIRFILQASVSSVETFGHMLEGVELNSRIIAIYAEVERACLKGVSRLKTQLADALVKMYAAMLAFLSRARQYFGQSSGKRVLKGAFQSYQTSVAPWIERIEKAEKIVLNLVGLVQSEGAFCRYNGTMCLSNTKRLTFSRSEEPPSDNKTRSARPTAWQNEFKSAER